MATVRLTQGTIHYHRAGRAGGTPLVLLSASPGDHRDFDAVVAALAQHFDVIAPDWPGYGASSPLATPEQASAMAFYEVLVEFLDVLGIAQAAFIGNSVGGYAATRLAIEQPQRVAKLVLVSPGGFTPHNVLTRFFCRWQGSALAIPPGPLARLYLRRHTPAADAMRARAAGEQSRPPARTQVRAIWRSFTDAEHDLRRRARNVRCPVLLVFGNGDPIIPWWLDGRVAQRAMPHAQFRRLPGGHAPFAEVPERFLEAALPFLGA
ncbi:MAG: alpha/beta fold hydrolase [Pseudomonadota bacterium]